MSNTMAALKTITIRVILGLILLGCQQPNKSDLSREEEGSVSIKLSFKPAFNEHSEIQLTSSKEAKLLRILVKNDLRADSKQDTFWFKEYNLQAENLEGFDSMLITICNTKIPLRYPVINDGITISSEIRSKSNSNFIYLRSPAKNGDSLGYSFSKLVIDIVRECANDTIILQYFDDLESYNDKSKWRRADSSKKIDRLRMDRYGWTIKK
jgi:hypothetical protein